MLRRLLHCLTRSAGAALALGVLSPAAHGSAEPGPPTPARDTVWLAWLDGTGAVRRVSLDREGRSAPWPTVPTRLPIGSLWKLAAHGRLIESGAAAEPYVCRGRDPEEVYCCSPGERIDRDTALWRSCGRYFEQALSALHAAERAPGRQTSGAAAVPHQSVGPSALLAAAPRALAAADLNHHGDLPHLGPVDLDEWLQWLGRWPVELRERTASALLPYWLHGPGAAVLGSTGTRLRVKTFTTQQPPDQPAEARPSPTGPQTGPQTGTPPRTGPRWAGASGWTQDGTPVWFAARGSSAAVVPQWAPTVLRFLDANGAIEAGRAALGRPAAAGSAGCVAVSYFADYPIAAITPRPARPGPLVAGDYRLDFANGQQVRITSRDDLRWSVPTPGRVAISGRLGLDDYVARVVEREGQGDPPAAARALAVAARTYLLSHARPEGGCLAIDDSSRSQRVAPRPAAAAARAAASATEGLGLVGSLGHYHADRAAPGVMAWQDAVVAARRGEDFVSILRTAYPDAALAALGADGSAGASTCQPLPEAARWLADRAQRWHRELAGEPGFRPPTAVQVCRLERGPPHALPALGRIYAGDARQAEDRLTLAHEYLHLAFAGHPRGQYEAFIEARARALLGVGTGSAFGQRRD